MLFVKKNKIKIVDNKKKKLCLSIALSSVVQSECYEATRILLYGNKQNNNFIKFFVSTLSVHISAAPFGEYPLDVHYSVSRIRFLNVFTLRFE